LFDRAQLLLNVSEPAAGGDVAFISRVDHLLNDRNQFWIVVLVP
jgi:hypothetical protein